MSAAPVRAYVILCLATRCLRMHRGQESAEVGERNSSHCTVWDYVSARSKLLKISLGNYCIAIRQATWCSYRTTKIAARTTELPKIWQEEFCLPGITT